jgi:F-type H+-transporting ATPase subunit delta
MLIEPVAVENWAEALHRAAKKAGQLDAVLEDAAILLDVYGRERKMAAFLEGPQFRTQAKQQFLDQVFSGRLHRLLLSTLHLLVAKDRMGHLPPILKRLAERVDEERGFVRGRVFTAVALSEEGCRFIREHVEAVTGLKFRLDFRVDPSLIGGVRVTYGDVLLDSTIRSQLNDLRELLHQTPVY